LEVKLDVWMLGLIGDEKERVLPLVTTNLIKI